jgi:hypothetical protein
MSAGNTAPRSHFGRAFEKLGIGLIAANGPQAKGRVERNRGVDQDRLVKELHLAGISGTAQASKFLEGTCLPRWAGNFHAPCPVRRMRMCCLGMPVLQIFFALSMSEK